MALLVTDQGEIDSLRTLLNATHEIPRNLVLKLYTGPATAPSEQDVPSATKYFEPYNATNNSGYGSAPTTGYPLVVNNRTEENQDFDAQYGILLNGNRWTIATTASAVANTTCAGTTGTYQITVASNTDIKKGDYAVASGIPDNTYVVDIDGANIELSQKLTATITAGTACSFGRGRTTASYPEQIFTFTSAAGNVYGYYLARANNMPVALQGVVDGGTVAALGTSIEKAGCKGVIGNDYIELIETPFTQAISSGAQNAFVLGVAAGGNLSSIAVGQRVSGTNIPAETRVSGIDGQNIYIDKPVTGGNASGDATFIPDVAKELTVGQAVTKTGGSGQTGPDAFPANTTIVGIDFAKKAGDIGPRVYLSNQLTDNVGTASSNDKVDFDYSVMTTDPSGSAVAHGLNPGDVIYIAQGTTSTITAQHYTVHTVPSSSTFTTTPALSGTGDATLYSSIFFAEQFTNGPYAIQNNGDQIKVTLNVSLD
tara:strand:- start:16487 stop:17935 length:1449 start_codon:yes stop_codon:yes gene_type:complete